MARKNEELRRRVEGKSGREDDDDESDFSGDSNDVDDRKALLKELQDISDGEKAPKGLMAMKFMSKQLSGLLYCPLSYFSGACPAYRKQKLPKHDSVLMDIPEAL